MITIQHAFSSFSVDDSEKAKEFYSNTLGLQITERKGMGLTLHLPGGTDIFIYSKNDHVPATFTILNFIVLDIEEAVDELTSHGVQFEIYKEGYLKTDEKGVSRSGGDDDGPQAMAWFKDPAGNFLALMQE